MTPPPAPSLTLRKVAVCYAFLGVVSVAMRLVTSDKPSPAGPVALAAVTTALGATAIWWAYHAASGRRDGLAVGMFLPLTLSNGDVWPVAPAVIAVLTMPLAAAFGAWLGPHDPPA